jgi:hypothetical protein
MTEDKQNLLDLWDLATKSERAAGLAWYRVAHDQAAAIAVDTGLSMPVVSAVIAALSPRCKWERNIVDAENMCRAYVNGFDPRTVSVGTFNRNKDRAAGILEQNDPDLLSGPKVNAFAHCIADPGCREVVVDSHAFNAFVGERAISGMTGPRIHNARYIRTSDAYVEVAQELGILPMQAQAVIWLTWKRVHNL